MTVFNPAKVKKARKNAPRDLLFPDVEADLLDRLADIKRIDFDAALWIGRPNAGVCAIKNIGKLTVMDSAMRPGVDIQGDEEWLPFGSNSLDLVVANATLQTVNDLPGALIQIRRALKPDGVFIAALPGGETLHQLRASIMRVETALRGGATPRVHPMIDSPTMAGLMQRAGFTLPVVDSDIKTIFYRKLRTLLKDIKASGEGMALAGNTRPYAGKSFWGTVEDDYRRHYPDAENLLEATAEIIYAIGWGPAESQPQPLRPGSAKNRMADALGTIETSLPDRTRPH